MKVLVLGDVCVDEYQYGTVDRISPEAPVPVFKLSHTDTKVGMAANVSKNLQAFGIEVDGYYGQVSYKTRLIDTKSGQHIVRIDKDNISDSLLLASIDFSNHYDAIVISDYNKGSVSVELVQALREQYDGPIFADTKKPNLIDFEGCFVKINETEFIHRTSECSNLIVTLGANGAMYSNEVFPTAKVEVVDVCGAGDTFLAALCFKYLTSHSIKDAIRFANEAATISVQHSGVYVLSPDDLSKCFY